MTSTCYTITATQYIIVMEDGFQMFVHKAVVISIYVTFQDCDFLGEVCSFELIFYGSPSSCSLYESSCISIDNTMLL